MRSFSDWCQKSFLIRSWVCAFRESSFLQVSCITLLSASSTAVFPLKQRGWVVVACLSTSCRANVSFTLICAFYRFAEKSAAALKRKTVPKGLLIRPPHAWDEASGDPVMIGTCRVASCHGTPFSRVFTSNHFAVRYCDRWEVLMASRALECSPWRYTWCAYRLAGCTATDILIHFPASFSS